MRGPAETDAEVRDLVLAAAPAPRARALVALCLLALGLEVAALGYGGYLVIAHPSLGGVNLGVLLLIAAVAFRPRLGRRPRHADCLTPDESPALVTLVAGIAAAADVPAPARIRLTFGDGALLTRSGRRGITTLQVGLRQWVTLAPQVRVALLARELARTRLDATRGLLLRTVTATARRLSYSMHAEKSWAYLSRPTRARTSVVVTVGNALRWAVSRPFRAWEALVVGAGLRARLYAAYAADTVAAEVAGTDAIVALVDRELFRDELDRLLYHTATYREPIAWRETVEAFLAGRTAQVPALRADAPEPTRWDEEPAPGERVTVSLAHSHLLPRVTLAAADAKAIDAELAAWFGALHHELLGPREFTARRPTARRP